MNEKEYLRYARRYNYTLYYISQASLLTGTPFLFQNHASNKHSDHQRCANNLLFGIFKLAAPPPALVRTDPTRTISPGNLSMYPPNRFVSYSKNRFIKTALLSLSHLRETKLTTLSASCSITFHATRNFPSRPKNPSPKRTSLT